MEHRIVRTKQRNVLDLEKHTGRSKLCTVEKINLRDVNEHRFESMNLFPRIVSKYKSLPVLVNMEKTTKREVKAVGYLGKDEPSLVQSY